jgi:hypothetical protein
MAQRGTGLIMKTTRLYAFMTKKMELHIPELVK